MSDAAARPWLGHALLLAAALTAAVAGYRIGQAHYARPPAVEAVSRPLSGLQVLDLDARPVPLERYSGQPLLLSFWATWCAPCLAEMPRLVEFASRHRGSLTVLAISEADTLERVQDYARRHQTDGLTLLHADTDVSDRLGNRQRVLPYTVAVDRHGRAVAALSGELTTAQLQVLAQAARGPAD